MEEVEALRESWCNDEIWELLLVPKPYCYSGAAKFWDKFLSIKKNWSWGRFIYKDCVVIKKAEWRDQE